MTLVSLLNISKDYLEKNCIHLGTGRILFRLISNNIIFKRRILSINANIELKQLFTVIQFWCECNFHVCSHKFHIYAVLVILSINILMPFENQWVIIWLY